MLGRRSRAAACLTKQARLTPGSLALGAAGGLAAGGAIAYHDVKRGLEGMSARNMAMRRAMGFKNSNIKPRYGYGALSDTIKGM